MYIIAYILQIVKGIIEKIVVILRIKEFISEDEQRIRTGFAAR